MVDNLKKKKPQDPKKINKNQDWEMDTWSKKLGVSKVKLKKTIEKVGPLVKDIKKELGK